jgi:selenide,water dikinase
MIMGEDIKLTKLTNCAGCGAKVGAGVLAKLLSDLPVLQDENLLVGFDKSDDAAVYRIKDDLAIVQTLDFFPPIADDPYTFGQIAATNALSDIYAMGGEPKLALNIMCVPKTMPKEAVHEILRGGYEKCAEAGAIICGGHSIYDDEPKYGLSVTGFVHPDRMWKNHGAKPGDILFLTKPIGIGVLTAAQRGDLLEPETHELMIRLMTTLNKGARDILINYDVHACTDVTGFSFLGHLYEMCSGSDVSAEIDVNEISLIPESLEFARIGILPEGMYRNRTYAENAVEIGNTELAVCDLLFDPQTSGGLLAAVDEKDADAVYEALKDRVPCVQRVGSITEKREKSIYLK